MRLKRGYYGLLIIGMIFLLNSCTIQKRRYRKGFHITSSIQFGKKHTSKPAETIELAEPDTLTIYQPVLEEEILSQHETEMEEPENDAIVEQNDAIADHVAPTLVEPQPLITTTPKHMPSQAIAPKQKQKKQMKTTNKRHIALMIGIGILLMALLAGLAVPVINSIFVLNAPVLTATNLAVSLQAFKAAIAGWVGIALLDLLVSWGVYKYYRDKRPKLAMLNGLLRLIYTGFLVGAIGQLIGALGTSSAGSIYSFLNAFNAVWGWGLIVFGAHLIVLGIQYENENGKKWLNWLIKSFLIIAGMGYMLQYIGILVVANPIAFATAVESVFIIFMVLGEIGFALWMLFKGGRRS